MHRKRAEKLSRKQKERYFISLYAREGAVEEKIPYAERRAGLKPSTGQIILRRKEVQEEIKALMEPVRIEQMRQQLVGDAVAQVTAELRADRDRIKRELDTLMAVPNMKAEGELLEDALMRLVVGLDFEKHPKVKLEAIKAAFVVLGTLEIKSTGWLSRRTSALRSS
jgi:seryl-tRNA synthetase